MTIVCIQCSMRAMLNDEQLPIFDETIQEHMARVHPDAGKTTRERVRLERQLETKLKKEGRI